MPATRIRHSGALARVAHFCHFWSRSLALALLGSLSAQATQLTLAVASLPHSAPVLIADAEGYFSAEGLQLKIIDCNNGARCMKHLIDGEAQFATVTDANIVSTVIKHRPMGVLATVSTSPREARMIARSDSGIRGAADLKGKRIGVLPGGASQYFADVFLLFHQIDPSQVTLVPLDGKDLTGPLLRREVDAASIFQPHSYLALKALGDKGLVIPNPRVFTVTFNLVSAATAGGANDADVIKLLRAVQRGQHLIQTDPARARSIVASRLRQDPQLMKEIWSDFDFALGLHQTLITTLEAQLRWSQRVGQTPSGLAPDFLDLIRPEPLRALDRRAVTLVK
jgi:ABC-type nitrate/sulfonate/bicarbonate transport system substrate-binding protein